MAYTHLNLALTVWIYVHMKQYSSSNARSMLMGLCVSLRTVKSMLIM